MPSVAHGWPTAKGSQVGTANMTICPNSRPAIQPVTSGFRAPSGDPNRAACQGVSSGAASFDSGDHAAVSVSVATDGWSGVGVRRRLFQFRRRNLELAPCRTDRDRHDVNPIRRPAAFRDDPDAGAGTRLDCGGGGYSCDDFETPSGNIKCLASTGPDGGGIACEIGSGLNPKPPSNGCPSGGDLAGLSVADRGAARFECRTDVSLSQLDKQIPALAYGAVWHGFGMFCISQENGLTCINRDGHGFFASRERWRMF